METLNAKLRANDAMFSNIRRTEAADIANRLTKVTLAELEEGEPTRRRSAEAMEEDLQMRATTATTSGEGSSAEALFAKMNDLTRRVNEIPRKSTAYFLQTYLFHQQFHEHCVQANLTINELFNRIRK
jgi:hypothetical protein